MLILRLFIDRCTAKEEKSVQSTAQMWGDYKCLFMDMCFYFNVRRKNFGFTQFHASGVVKQTTFSDQEPSKE